MICIFKSLSSLEQLVLSSLRYHLVMSPISLVGIADGFLDLLQEPITQKPQDLSGIGN